MAVTAGRIVFVGTRKQAKQFQAKRITNLQGAHLFPGFTDAHAHLFGIGQREVTLNLETTKSLAEMMQAVRQQAEQQPTGNITGRGWIETHWPEARFPNRYDLERAVPGRVVVLRRADGHALVASSSALQAAGIDLQTQDPDGGRIERDGEGAPSGILVDHAMSLVAALTPAPTGEARRASLLAGANVMAGYGWTGVHNMSVGRDDVLLLENMAETNTLPIRVYNGIDQDVRDLLADGPRFKADGRAITRAIKIYMDGALGSRGAALLAPYADEPQTAGLMLTSAEQTLPLLEQALQNGWQIEAHAIGDRGNQEVLNWMQGVFAKYPDIANPRWRVEHAQMLAPSDISRFAELGIIPSMQPSHAIGDLYFAKDRVGAKRLQGAYAWNKLIEAGAIIAAGSDAPVERGDLRIEFYATIARAGLDGFQTDDWQPDQALSRQNALKSFTLWPAFASFQEDDLGTVETGKRADFSVFDRDLMTVAAKDILQAEVLWTIVDGKDSYKAKVLVP
ncbi:FIG00481917: hypothetical protein [hydrothermal vent metagenome]|uniref:Amidohydrolase 3 domain-containing protein n=1 Tax=hydrothermal vent metagenome TaxID=652676 RepID=A0A3B0SBL7_9ZZZZ